MPSFTFCNNDDFAKKPICAIQHAFLSTVHFCAALTFIIIRMFVIVEGYNFSLKYSET